ncbi:PP2C family protein-serine/threonine phosphatase [Actinomadura viridis]|uniref:Serine phosphatase RsbU (Regulator of sigma subunit) n=1 Tax=Actinomadura viridis TaxID=58110 RepID=A0A931DU62_9ACTN|nr:PP2C family protein-serine/threonine phosphatase [Actinomadura viridis]MBG6093926.1 serine phosphatase RsbU (regulator of sigma subunit) [Actinomadura viridis]
MISPGRPELVERALRAAPSHALPEVLAARIRDLFPAAGRARLLLADYHLRVLFPADLDPLDGDREPEAVKVHGTAAGRAFASLGSVLAPARAAAGGGEPRQVLYVPVTARGERLGVLSVELTGSASPSGSASGPVSGLLSGGGREADQADLAEIGEITGEALKLAWNLTDRYERIRRRRRMSLAAELQWQLLPGQGCAGPEFSLAGHLEPAYSIGGDGFDWTTERDHLTLSVINGSGTGIRAALLTSLTIGALRNARRSGADLAEQVSLAGDTVYGRYGGKEFTEALVMRVELGTGLVSVIDAGSPRILRIRGSQVTPIELEHQMPPGMFADTEYRPQHFHLEPGDRLVIISAGLSTPSEGQDSDGGPFQVEKAIRRARLLPTPEVPLSIIGALLDHRHDQDLTDDAVVVCLDWKNNGTGTTGR